MTGRSPCTSLELDRDKRDRAIQTLKDWHRQAYESWFKEINPPGSSYFKKNKAAPGGAACCQSVHRRIGANWARLQNQSPLRSSATILIPFLRGLENGWLEPFLRSSPSTRVRQGDCRAPCSAKIWSIGRSRAWVQA